MKFRKIRSLHRWYFLTYHPMQRRSTEWVQKHVINRPEYVCRLEIFVRGLEVSDEEYAHLMEIGRHL